MKNFFNDFKAFVMRGNVLDLAVGIIIGAAFTNIVNSLVNDLIMPLITLLTGGADFADAQFTIGGASFTYGNFISAIIQFLLIALVVFLLVRGISKLYKKPEGPPPIPCPYCKKEVDKDATRCPFCTSDLTPEKAEAS